MHFNTMRSVTMYDRSNILGYNRRILAPFGCGNILGLNTAFTHHTGSVLGTVAALGVGLGAQTLSNSLNGQQNNMQTNQQFVQSYTPPQNGFNNVTSAIGSPMNNVQPAYGANNNATPIPNYNTPPVQLQYLEPSR